MAVAGVDVHYREALAEMLGEAIIDSGAILTAGLRLWRLQVVRGPTQR